MPPSRPRTSTLPQLLTVLELGHLDPSCFLRRKHWRRLSLSFDQERNLFEPLFRTEHHVRKGALRDPFVAALQRLRQRDAPLPLRHRWALADLHQELALPRLALEEAHLRAWRQLDLRPLRQMVAWLDKKPFGENPVAIDLQRRADTYLAGCLPREGDFEQCALASEKIIDGPSIEVHHELSLPRLLALALCWALDPEGPEVFEAVLRCADGCLQLLELSPDLRVAAGLPELRAEHALVRGAALGLRGRHLDAESLYRETLAGLTPEADPFLRLTLLQEAASAAHHAALVVLEIHGREIAAVLDRPRGLPSRLTAREGEALAQRALEALDAERETFARVAAWLAEAAPLLAVHGNPQQHLRQRWLAAFTTQWDDPAGSVLALIETFDDLLGLDKRPWLLPLAGDLMLLLPRLRHVEPGRRAEVLRALEGISQPLLHLFERSGLPAR